MARIAGLKVGIPLIILILSLFLSGHGNAFFHSFGFFKIRSSGTTNFSDTWSSISTVNAPAARSIYSHIWTGSKILFWGGAPTIDSVVNTGGIYTPATDSWSSINTTGAPSSRDSHSTVWTGTKMIVWGGVILSPVVSTYLNSGGIYDPATDSWTTMSSAGAPSIRSGHQAVWTGTKMIVWGGRYFDGGTTTTVYNNGGIYDPVTDSWSAISTVGAPSVREKFKAVWTGTQMIVWGGNDGTNDLADGAIYTPATDTWSAMSSTNAPSARSLYSAVWTGSKMIIWGGSPASNTGAIYDPATDSWTSTSTSGAPTLRYSHAAVWTGTHMLVWGGIENCATSCTYPTNGGIYEVSTNSWTTMTSVDSPSDRAPQVAVWTGDSLVIWSGSVQFVWGMDSGGIYQ